MGLQHNVNAQRSAHKLTAVLWLVTYTDIGNKNNHEQSLQP